MIDRNICSIENYKFYITMYYNSKKLGTNEELVVYENPTSSDIKEIVKMSKGIKGKGLELRFSIDGLGKKVYVWDAYYGTHPEAEKLVEVTDEIKKGIYFFQGYSNKNLAVTHLHTNFYNCPTLIRSCFNEFEDSKWIWVNQYLLEFTRYLSKVREDFRRYSRNR